MSPKTSRKRLLASALAGTVLASGSATAVFANPADEPSTFPENTEAVHDLDDAITETVYVESDIDSDRDGNPDLIAVEVMRPAETEDGLTVPVIAHASPYFGLNEKEDVLSTDGRQIPDNVPGEHFTEWYHEYFVPRGYGYIEPAMQGTAGSEGCPTTGGEEDTASIVASIDWLAGRATAYNEDGDEVTADWAEPEVGMVGSSYRGTLANAVAATGIEEVKTIVPIAAISSWYDYTSSHGIRYAFFDEYPRYLADFVANENALEVCGDVWDELDEGMDDETADMNEFWDERNYRNDADQMHASVLHVHGQAEFNVKMPQAIRWWEALGEEDVDQKMWLHAGEHEEFLGDSDEGQEYLHRWFDHWLMDIDTGIMEEDDVRVDRADDSTDTFADWPADSSNEVTFSLTEDSDGNGHLSEGPGIAGQHQIAEGNVDEEDYVIEDPFDDKELRQAYLTNPLDDRYRLSDTVEVDLTFSSSTSSAPVNAFLVHYDEYGEVVELISQGAADGRNHVSLWESEPLEPGEEYSVTFDLEPKDYRFDQGDRIGLVFTGNYEPYTIVDDNAGELDIHLAQSTVTMNLITDM